MSYHITQDTAHEDKGAVFLFWIAVLRANIRLRENRTLSPLGLFGFLYSFIGMVVLATSFSSLPNWWN